MPRQKSLHSCNFTMPKRKHNCRLLIAKNLDSVATLPCQSGNFIQSELVLANPSVATLPCQSGNETLDLGGELILMLQLYHAKAETCESECRRRCGRDELQLYHAKAETSILCALKHRVRSCNFTMPKRKLVREAGLYRLPVVATLPCQSGNSEVSVDTSSEFLKLQLYHAKAETQLRLAVPQLPRTLSCNFTMPKRKLST